MSYQIRLSDEAYTALLEEVERSGDGLTIRQTASRILLAALRPASSTAKKQESSPLATFAAEFCRLWGNELASRGFRRVTERQLLSGHKARLQGLFDYFDGNTDDLAAWIDQIAGSAYLCGKTEKRRTPADLRWLLENHAKIWEEPAQTAVAVIRSPQKPMTTLDAVLQAAELRRNAYLAQEGV